MIAAHAAAAVKESLTPFSYDPAPLGDYGIEIAITHCGLCHSDLHLIDNDWKTSVYPLVPGHEIVGTAVAAGPSVGHLRVGQRVGVGWQRSACLTCELCLDGQDNLCATQTATCVGHYGGLAERIVTDARFAFAIADELDSATTAPLLCGGVTVYSPLRRFAVGPRSRVAVIGIGGLGHIAVKMARALGAEVTAFSSSANKRQTALELGAHEFATSTDVKEVRRFAKHFDLILSTVNARMDWVGYMQTLRPNGVLCLVGAPPGLIQIPAAMLLSTQQSVTGSDIGSRAMITDMLQFAAKHKIGAQVETVPMSTVNDAITRLRANLPRYRMVLENK